VNLPTLTGYGRAKLREIVAREFGIETEDVELLEASYTAPRTISVRARVRGEEVDRIYRQDGDEPT
jgi:hypothetical protein